MIAWITRHRRLLIGLAVLLVIAVRAALPEVLRRVLVTKASQALHARVDVGDIDLAVLSGGIVLADVAVRPADAPPAEVPLVAWKRLEVTWRWWPLVHRAVRLRTIALDDPHVAVERLLSGALNLTQLIPASDPAPVADAPPPATPPDPAKAWTVGVDRVVLRDGGVRFLDRMVTGSEPIDLQLPTVAVDDIALQPGVYGEAAHLHVLLRLDRGRIRADARILPHDGGFDIATEVKGHRLALQRARLYIPDVGWRSLDGELGFELHHRIEQSGVNDLRGALSLRDLKVQVPGLDQPALAWEHLLVALDVIDLAGRRAFIRSVDLNGPSVVANLTTQPALPLLAHEAADAPPPPPPPAEPTPPWHWRVGVVRVARAVAHVGSNAPPLDVGLDLAVRGLAGDGDPPVAIRAEIRAETATVDIGGTAHLKSPGFAGTVAVRELDVPRFVAVSGVAPAPLFRKGRVKADLDIEAGSGASPAGDVVVRGTISTGDTLMTSNDPREFAVGSRSSLVKLDELRLPGLLAPVEKPRQPAPIRIAVGQVRTTGMAVQLTRNATGVVVPDFTAGRPPQPPPATPPPAAAPPGPGVDVVIKDIQMTGGTVRFSDRAVKPPYLGELSRLDVSAREFRWPFALDRAKVTMAVAPRGSIDAEATLGARDGRCMLRIRDLALPPFTPYSTAYSPYSVTRGALTVNGRAAIAGARYDTTTDVVLHDLHLGGADGDSLFSQQFGIPLTIALGLMRDLHGDITLTVPVAVDPSGVKVDIWTIVGGVLKQALMGALTSPLKLIGAALPGGDGAPAGPAPIAFRPGRSDLAPEGADRLGQLGKLLGDRPGIAVTLSGSPSAADARWLAEQQLRGDLEQPKGVAARLAALRDRAARDRVFAALKARAGDEPGALDENDTKQLELWLAERPAVASEALLALTTKRLGQVVQTLQDEHHVAAARITRRQPAADPTDAPPSIGVELGAAPTSPPAPAH